ncbi:hypothetical protein Cgig2_019962 [Carnegiea gigantea]|uniref:Glucosidase 2 subunit beta n=1 Tax=Carnegiea gigantea TaxID=171969 RepID=A0A9Q1GWV5_9CARY|nr:hypothetical protein Cgig2_019962 [Carnegiea gigantea]
MKLMLLKFLLILSFVSPYIVRSASLSSNPLLGVSPEDEKYYSTSSEFIKCKDGSKKFHRSQLNDDFCDCPDGSDEPGTSACPNGSFYCKNAGHMPLILFSSRVNDGICDCCDGSDEYDGKIKCPNTCWEAGKAARDKLKKKIATYQEGVALRRREVEQAKQAFAKDEAELSKLKDEEKLLKGLVQQLKERKEQIEKAEEKERLEKEKEEKMKQEAEKESNQEKKEAEEKAESGKENNDNTTHDTASDFHDSLDEVDGQVGSEIEHEDSSEKEGSNSNAPELPTKENNEEDTAASDPKLEHNTAETESTEGLSKEELGRLVASRWTGEKTDPKTGDADDAKEISGAEETPKNEQEDDYEGYASEFDEPDPRYDDPDSDDHVNDDFADEDHGDSASYKSDSDDESVDSDVTASSNPSWLEKIQNTVKSLLHAVNLFQTPLNTSDAARVRKEYDESSAKLSKIQSRISSLSDKLKLDFGPEKEFYSMYGHCFEAKQNKYVYKVCPFKKASQDEGHSTTRLGSWEKFEDTYKSMLFSNGDRCWNGPDRSLKVKLRCGLKNELTDVDEPSRCEYIPIPFSLPRHHLCLFA